MDGSVNSSCRETYSERLTFFRLLNRAEKECEAVNQGYGKLLAGIIQIEVIGIIFEECIDNSKCNRTKSAMPFAGTLICQGHVTRLVAGHIGKKEHLPERIPAP